MVISLHLIKKKNATLSIAESTFSAAMNLGQILDLEICRLQRFFFFFPIPD